MNELQKLQDRVSSLHDLKGLFRAMRVMAASHVQEAELGLDGARHYAKIIGTAISEATLLMSGNVASAESHSQSARQSEGSQLIVVCTEHGFAGALNDKLLDQMVVDSNKDQELLVIGRRGAVHADERGLPVAWNSPMPTHLGGIPNAAGAVLGKLKLDKFIRIIFARYSTGGGYAVESRQIMPLDVRLFASIPNGGAPPFHHLAPEQLMQQLIGEYLFAEITLAMIEALASENVARLQIMQQADRNIDAKLDLLVHDERAERQEAITSELLDVVTGSMAVRR